MKGSIGIWGGIVWLLLSGCQIPLDDIKGPTYQLKWGDLLAVYDSLMEDRKIIYLQQDSSKLESLLGDIEDFVVDSPRIFVVDRGWVKVYDWAGRFQQVLGARGEGPAEYRRPHKIFKCNDHLVVYDAPIRLLFYTLQGYHLTGRIDYSFYGSLFEDQICVGDHIYVAPRGMNRKNPYHVLQFDRGGKIKAKAILMNPRYRDYFLRGAFDGKLLAHNNQIVFASSIYEKIYFMDYHLVLTDSISIAPASICENWTWPEMEEESAMEASEIFDLYDRAKCLIYDMQLFDEYTMITYMVHIGRSMKDFVTHIYREEDDFSLYAFDYPFVRRVYLGGRRFVELRPYGSEGFAPHLLFYRLRPENRQQWINPVDTLKQRLLSWFW